jgi:hypothetical protein
MTDKGIKHDQGKLRYDLIPPHALEELAKVYTQGAEKYGEYNWSKGITWSRIFAAIMRHLWAFWKGEDIDSDSGISHVTHAMWGCFTLVEYYKSHPELDDRVKVIEE